jgi:hypothetical protein
MNTNTIQKEEVITGDILLYHGNSLVSKLIRFFDGTDVNHASICLGEDEVGEALGKGLTKRTIDDSIKDAEYVIVRRLKTAPGTMQPVVLKAEYYLDIGNRYGFEQIVLLALLGLTRKLHVNNYLKWLLRKILNQATDWLMIHGDKQPMICSEFVYRCYNEALPDEHDPYSLVIEPFPGTIKSSIPGARSSSTAARGKNIHPDSLLALVSTSNVLLRSFEKGTAKKMEKELSAEEKKIDVMPLDDLIKNYLEEAEKPKVKALEPEARRRSLEMLSSPEMLDSIKRFSEAFYSATKVPKSKAKESRFAEGDETRLPASLDHLLKTVADFVTPGDLSKCADLHSIGSMTPKASQP